MDRYIHYGDVAFDSDKFVPVKNQEWGAAKPTGGFWASQIDSEWGWKQWCESEEFCVDELSQHFTFTLKEDARVCHIKSVEDLYRLPKWQGIFKSTWYPIDFEKAMENWDAIQLHLSDEVKDDWLEGLYFKLYGWDCDSILIMNKNIVVAED